MFSLTLIYFVILIAQIGNCIRKALSAHYSLGFEDSMQNLFFAISWLVTCTHVYWCLDCRALYDLPSYTSDTWRRYTVKCLCWCVEGQMRWEGGVVIEDCLEVCLVGQVVGGKLCMVPGHSCHIYLGWQCKQHRGGGSGVVLNGKGVSLMYWVFIIILLGTAKDFIGYLFYLHYCCFLFQFFCFIT